MNFLTDMNHDCYYKIANSLLKPFFKPHKRQKDSYITDATPVACDINTIMKYITEDQLKKLRLKYGDFQPPKAIILAIN